MNSMTLARNAYAGQSREIRTPRSNEYEAFARATAALKQLEANPDAPATERVAALHQNRSLWKLIAASVADDENALPATLRAQLFYLAEFSEKESRDLLRGNGDLSALIDVNTSVMKGLGQSQRGTT